MMEAPSNINPDPDSYIYTAVDTTSTSLAMTNGHERDADITFFEEGHIYDVKGDTSFMSAATFVHSFFEGFVEQKDGDFLYSKVGSAQRNSTQQQVQH